MKWVLHEADPRVRANAIEALWWVDTPEARALLHLATNDSDNRVLGNALLGLYYLGDCAVLEQLIKLSADAPAGFRATAAWVLVKPAIHGFTTSSGVCCGNPLQS